MASMMRLTTSRIIFVIQLTISIITTSDSEQCSTSPSFPRTATTSTTSSLATLSQTCKWVPTESIAVENTRPATSSTIGMFQITTCHPIFATATSLPCSPMRQTWVTTSCIFWRKNRCAITTADTTP